VHQDWLVVSGAGELSVDEEVEDDASPEDVLVAAGVVVLAVVVEPIEPS
jgi:hypothetical protein